MKRIPQFLSVICLFGLLLYSCDAINSPSMDHTGDRSSTSEALRSVIENDNTLTFSEGKIEVHHVERGFNEADETTTFSYTVVNNGATPSPGKFFLEWAACDDELVFKNANPDYDVRSGTRIQWNPAIPDPVPREYSITFEGDVSPGIITAGLTQASSISTGSIAGPGCGEFAITHTLSGSIFIDVDEDGAKNQFESGPDGIEIFLQRDSEDFISTLTTDGGLFSFDVPANHDYEVIAPETLFDGLYTPTTSTSFSFTDVTDDESGIDFGYKLEVDDMVNYLNGLDEINTKSTQYWVFQFRHALSNRGQVIQNNPNIDYDADELGNLLDIIEEFLLEVPFQFGDDDRLQEALNILIRPFRNDYDELLQHLLTAQLNVFSDRGAYTAENGEILLNDPFNLSVIIFGETIACVEMGACASGSASKSGLISNETSVPGILSFATLSDGTKVLSAFNGTGGIGR
jgi:hypothetical protein